MPNSAIFMVLLRPPTCSRELALPAFTSLYRGGLPVPPVVRANRIPAAPCQKSPGTSGQQRLGLEFGSPGSRGSHFGPPLPGPLLHRPVEEREVEIVGGVPWAALV